jgi:hypothetical protein
MAHFVAFSECAHESKIRNAYEMKFSNTAVGYGEHRSFMLCHVRIGSGASILTRLSLVRFTPNSDQIADMERGRRSGVDDTFCDGGELTKTLLPYGEYSSHRRKVRPHA